MFCEGILFTFVFKGKATGRPPCWGPPIMLHRMRNMLIYGVSIHVSSKHTAYPDALGEIPWQTIWCQTASLRTTLPNHQLYKQNKKNALPRHQITKSPNHQTCQSPNHRTTQAPIHQRAERTSIASQAHGGRPLPRVEPATAADEGHVIGMASWRFLEWKVSRGNQKASPRCWGAPPPKKKRRLRLVSGETGRKTPTFSAGNTQALSGFPFRKPEGDVQHLELAGSQSADHLPC